MLAGIGLSKNGLLTEAQWQPLEFMRQRGKTIRPRQRQPQRKETRANRGARLSKSLVTRHYDRYRRSESRWLIALTTQLFPQAACQEHPRSRLG
jgi:hypothetical protein